MNAGNDAEISRIKTLISAIGNYGVDKKYLFAVEDLHQAKHIPKVVRCLEEIEKLVNFFLIMNCKPNFEKCAKSCNYNYYK